MSYVGIQRTVVTPSAGQRSRAIPLPVRILDLTVGSLALLFLAPLMLLVAVCIRIQDGGPAFFAHRRIGKDGRMFSCLKLRTMAADADERLETLLANDAEARVEWERDHKLRTDPRITPIGQLLRRSSIDEIPQLLNVLRGEMSLVGPRPITLHERQRYGHRFSDYCRVSPGITGLWQVSGRNNTTYRRRVAMDVIYSRKKTVGLDLLILLKTIPAVLTRSGSY